MREHIPIIRSALRTVREQIQLRKDDTTCTNMKVSVEGCKLKATHLAELYLEVVSLAADARVEHYRKAVREQGEMGHVETLMKKAMGDVRLLLTVDEKMEAATKPQFEMLSEAINKIPAILPTLKDERPAIDIRNLGGGPQNVHTGTGAQHNNNGSGPQINGGTGTWHNPVFAR
ncbi:hypothetical protein V8C42DRAFT_319209 [Trichoderma barbatum]